MITIKKRTYTLDQAHYLLRNNGWKDDVEAFLASLPEGKTYNELYAFKRHFRDWKRFRQEEKNRLTPEQEKAEWDTCMQNPKVKQAYEWLCESLEVVRLRQKRTNQKRK